MTFLSHREQNNNLTKQCNQIDYQLKVKKAFQVIERILVQIKQIKMMTKKAKAKASRLISDLCSFTRKVKLDKKEKARYIKT